MREDVLPHNLGNLREDSTRGIWWGQLAGKCPRTKFLPLLVLQGWSYPIRSHKYQEMTPPGGQGGSIMTSAGRLLTTPSFELVL